MFAGLFSSNSAKENALSKGSPQRRLSTTASAKPPVIIHKPPFPHPLPHTRIRVVLSKDGIIISGHRGNASSFSSRSLLLPYGKAAAASVLEDHDATEGRSSLACIAYGCLGVLRLFNGRWIRSDHRSDTLSYSSSTESYLLLITSKKRAGNYAESPNKRIYCLTG